MATSGSVNFTQTCAEIIKDALVMVGAIEDEATPSAEQYQYAKRVLNRMAKAWSARGMKTWQWQEGELFVVPGVNQYSIGPGGDLDINRPLEITNLRRYVDYTETQIFLNSRSDFMNQSSKETEGKAVYAYYDPQTVLGQLYIWPAPDDMDSIKFSYKSYIEDFDNLSDEADFPVQWLEALVYGLAVRLIPKYEVRGEDAARLTAMAADFLNDAEINDVDNGSVFLQPEVYY